MSKVEVMIRAVAARLLLALVLAAAFATAQGQRAPGLVVGGSVTVAAGETATGDLTAVGAGVTIARGAVLDGHLITVGGTTTIDGTVRGDVHAYGGEVVLGPAAHVAGDVRAPMARYQPAAGAVVDGIVEVGTGDPIVFRLPQRIEFPRQAVRMVAPRNGLGVLPQSLALGVLALLIVAGLPRRIDRVQGVMVAAPVRAGLEGLVVMVVAVVVMVVLAVTLIGIPLALIGGMLLYASVLFGWIALGDALGTRLSQAIEQPGSRALWAGIGTFVLSVVVLLAGRVPLVGGVVMLVLSVVALGAVRMTRYGGRDGGRPGKAPAAEGGPVRG
jgi:hypothetical protein